MRRRWGEPWRVERSRGEQELRASRWDGLRRDWEGESSQDKETWSLAPYQVRRLKLGSSAMQGYQLVEERKELE